MRKANIDDYELGNLMYGNSRGHYVVPRGTWQDLFCDFLEKNGFSEYGFYNKSDDEYFENDTFIIRPYYWGDDDTKAELPNFVHKPSGLEISWYKYPMRNAFASQNISTKKFMEILDDCRKSLDELEGEDD